MCTKRMFARGHRSRVLVLLAIVAGSVCHDPGRAVAGDAEDAAFPEPAGIVSLADAYAAAIARSPELRAAADEVRAREALAF